MSQDTQHLTRSEVITNDYDVDAFVAMDTIGALIERVRALVETGRAMTVVARSLDRGEEFGEPDLYPSARLFGDPVTGGVRVWYSADGDSASLYVPCEPLGSSWGFGANTDTSPSESEVRRRYHSSDHDRRQDVTLVRIEGRPDTLGAKVAITYWNQHGYGRQTTVLFQDPPRRREVAESQAKVLDALAEQTSWSQQDLRALAARARREWEPVTSLLDPSPSEQG